MTYKITQRCINLVEALFNEGYDGVATITNRYATGTYSVLGDIFSIELTGFCKETLYVVEDIDTEELLFVGRYAKEYVSESVEGIVDLAWGVYKSYKHSGYSIPCEFEELFKKYGYLVKETVPVKTVWKERG